MCLTPETLKKKNFNSRKFDQKVPCGRCIDCLKAKRNAWTIRLKSELKMYKTGHFVTLTYNEEHLPWGDSLPTLDKRDLKTFIKRIRNFLGRGYTVHHSTRGLMKFPPSNQKFKYFAQGEYGSKFDRPHYHVIFFGLPEKIDLLIEECWKRENKQTGKFESLGHCHFGTATEASIHYSAKYLLQLDHEWAGRQKPFLHVSKGMGIAYVDKMGEFHRSFKRYSVTEEGGTKYTIPRYIAGKIFSEDQLRERSDEMSTLVKKRNIEIYKVEKNQSAKYLQDKKDAYVASETKRFKKFDKL